jgi:hypothetical protein
MIEVSESQHLSAGLEFFTAGFEGRSAQSGS